MKVFISWSGKIAEAVAIALRDWLPMVIQSVQTYVSSEDIIKGARWESEISKELEASDFGIICITPGNATAPWLNFEAGALSKSIEKGRVAPFLFRVERSEIPSGPLVQFQNVVQDKADVLKLVQTLNSMRTENQLTDTQLEQLFELLWPKLDEQLDAIPAEEQAAVEERRPAEDLLAEILEIVRSQQQMLNDPSRLLPASYLTAVLQRQAITGVFEPQILQMVNTELAAVRAEAASEGMSSDLAARLDLVDSLVMRAIEAGKSNQAAWRAANIARFGSVEPSVVRREYTTRAERERRAEERARGLRGFSAGVADHPPDDQSPPPHTGGAAIPP